MRLVLAEKPSVAADLARALGSEKSKTSFHNEAWTITWCVGHLCELEEPANYDPRWKSWRMDLLPMVPEVFRLRPTTHAPEQFRAVRTLLRDRRFREVINACDAGREGELIFRYAYELSGSRLPVSRLWISALTDEAIRAGFAKLENGERYDNLAAAARSRSEADWLVGLNATRAMTLLARNALDPSHRAKGPLLSIGRVQTPTLALIVQRDQKIEAFKPDPFWHLEGEFTHGNDTFRAQFVFQKQPRIATQALADTLQQRCTEHGSRTLPSGPRVVAYHSEEDRMPAPLLFDLGTLQRTANRRYGFSAAKTLELAQSLYEKHKVLSYPRTDSKHLPRTLEATFPARFEALRTQAPYATWAQSLLDSPPRSSRRVCDDAKVQDHHAIVPTEKPVRQGQLSGDEAKLYDLVARRFLGIFMPDARFELRELWLAVGPGNPTVPVLHEARKPTHGPVSDPDASPEDDPSSKLLQRLPPAPDLFRARSRQRTFPGWQDVAGFEATRESRDEALKLPELQVGLYVDGKFHCTAHETSPPLPYTDATLLSAMEGAGDNLEEDALREALKDRGLGTPATRADVLETLLTRDYVFRDKKTLRATEAGRALIAAVPSEELCSPQVTGMWEAKLAQISRGQLRREDFMTEVTHWVRALIAEIRRAPPPTTPSMPRFPSAHRRTEASTPAAVSEPLRGSKRGATKVRTRKAAPKAAVETPVPARIVCPRCQEGQIIRGRRGYGCSRWRDGCSFVLWFVQHGRELTTDEAVALLRHGRSPVGRWPRSPEGTTQKAFLTLDPACSDGSTHLHPGPETPSRTKRKAPSSRVSTKLRKAS